MTLIGPNVLKDRFQLILLPFKEQKKLIVYGTWAFLFSRVKLGNSTSDDPLGSAGFFLAQGTYVFVYYRTQPCCLVPSRTGSAGFFGPVEQCVRILITTNHGRPAFRLIVLPNGGAPTKFIFSGLWVWFQLDLGEKPWIVVST